MHTKWELNAHAIFKMGMQFRKHTQFRKLTREILNARTFLKIKTDPCHLSGSAGFIFLRLCYFQAAAAGSETDEPHSDE